MLIIFNITMPVMKLIFTELIRLGVVNPSKTPTDLYANLSFIVTTFAIIVIYKKYRWRIVDDPTLFCIQCGYDLTGNESGACLECGTEVQT